MRKLNVIVVCTNAGQEPEPKDWGPEIRVMPALDRKGQPWFGGAHAVVVQVDEVSDERGVVCVGRARRDYPGLPVLALLGPQALPFGAALVRAGADAYLPRGAASLDAVLRSLVVRAEREAEQEPGERRLTLWLDGQNTVRRCEGPVEQVLGRDPELLIGRELQELVPADMIPMTSLAIEQVRTGQTATARVQIRAEHGSGRILRLEGLISRRVGEPEVRVFLEDITEAWTAAQALRESEQRFESFLNAAPIGIAVVDAAGHLAHTNEAFQRMMGYHGRELSERSVADLTYPEDLPKDEAFFLELMAGKRDSYQIEKRYVRKDGQLVEGRLTVFVQRDEEGRPAVGYGMLEDITDRRALEDQLRQAQKLEALGRLAGGVAHDFNNLLTSIRGSASLLLEDLPRDSAFREEAEEILASSERAAHLTRQLLTFSRKAVGTDELLDPGELITGMERMLQRLIPATIELRTRLAPGVGPIFLDRTHFEQVLVNLVVNAVDAMEEGSGTIELSTEPVVCQVPGEQEGRPGVRISVRDDGAGMDEQVRSHIFEPFFTTKEPGKGTGLGLATVYGIVARAGGRITVDSAPGEGTTFHVDLPESEGRPAGPVARRAKSADGRQSGTILIVEDNPSVLRLAERVLERTGYRVLTASQGDDALGMLEELGTERLDLLLTDAVMPGIGGAELAREVRSRHPETRVVFMSGYDADEVIGEETADRSAGFLAKPFTPGELRENVREALAGR